MSEDTMISQDQQESVAETPADYDISIGGVACQVKFVQGKFSGRARPELHIPVKAVLQVLEVLPHIDPIEEGELLRFVAADADGQVLFGAFLAFELKWQYENYIRTQSALKLHQEYADKERSIRDRVRSLVIAGQVIKDGSPLEDGVRKFSRFIAWNVVGNHASGKLQSLERSIENELARLERTSPLEEFVSGLLSGSITHDYTEHNLRVIKALEALSVRSGGFIERLDPEKLERHYRSCIGDLTTGFDRCYIDLSLRLGDYAPRDIVDDPELTLAPEQLTLPGNKGGMVAYPVTYSYRQQDGEEVPTGTISVPLAVYKKLAPEYKQASGFPELPHDIRLYLAVTCDGKVLAQGFDTVELADKVRKAEKARGRKKHAEAGGTSLITGLKLQPDTTAPWWYQGATKPDRRR